MPFFVQKRQQNQNTPQKTQMDPKLTPNESPAYP